MTTAWHDVEARAAQTAEVAKQNQDAARQDKAVHQVAPWAKDAPSLGAAAAAAVVGTKGKQNKPGGK